jgi:hypothetical protein
VINLLNPFIQPAFFPSSLPEGNGLKGWRVLLCILSRFDPRISLEISLLEVAEIKSTMFVL